MATEEQQPEQFPQDGITIRGDRDRVAGTVEVPFQVQAKEIDYIICGSFEGGSNYWMFLDKVTHPHFPEGKPNGIAWSVFAADALLHGGSFTVGDRELAKSEREYTDITLEKMLNGVKMFLEKKGTDAWNDRDAGDDDLIVQYAAFGEAVFG